MAREKAAIARADDAERELTEAKSKLEGGFPEQVKRLGLHGDLIAAEDAKTLERYETLKGWKAWLREHEEGYEGTGGEDKSLTAQEVRKRLSNVEDELEEIGFRAREIRSNSDKRAREIWQAGLKSLRGKAEGGNLKPEGGTGKKPVAKPPKLPSGTGAPRPTAGARKAKTGFDHEEFKRQGGTRAALEKQFEKTIG